MHASVSVAEQACREDGTKFSSTTLFLYQVTFGRGGNSILVSDDFGFGDAVMSLYEALRSASVSAVMLLTGGTVDRR